MKIMFSFFISAAVQLFAAETATLHGFTVSIEKGTLRINQGKDEIAKCAIKLPKDPSPSMNWRNDVILLSDNQYITLKDVSECKQAPLVPATTPAKAGLVVDVNTSTGIYLALDTISAGPISYLATVAKLGSTKSLVTLRGAYLAKAPVKKLQESGFDYDPADPPKLSRDGQYASPKGDFDCSKDSFPGIWDIKNNKKIFINAESPEELVIACKKLFM